MPRSTKTKKTTKKKTTTKKTAKKKPVKKTTTKKRPARKVTEPKSRDYIVINEIVPEMEAKNRLVWLIVIILAFCLLIFWFWTLKQNVEEQSANNNEQLQAEINSTVDELKNIFNDTKSIISQATENAEQQREIERIKNEIMIQLQLNLDSSGWPQHSSDIFDISVQYPPDWSKQEARSKIVNGNFIILKSFPVGSSTPELFSSITFSWEFNDKYNDLEELAEAMEDGSEIEGYEILENKIYLDRQPAIKYVQIEPSENNFSYLIFLMYNSKIYRIEVLSQGGKNLVEPIVEKVLQTIEFL